MVFAARYCQFYPKNTKPSLKDGVSDPGGFDDVLSYLAAGMTYQEILADFPYLTQEDILACLSYAAD
ncbi:MAG: DUF433 domain-containing protein [Jaaginema sp. PMC 1079.18]|nr:DUF433 domain-containing protein [Jaaginema sp. PMC 1080.18]MEC4853891.1 DUF433 domain-containing protein [Jaaginema sp. PMC 1079.18]MEC4865008.1 DUF433 domain-containing protein [Jaaginema sp. PMC 1078.18]